VNPRVAFGQQPPRGRRGYQHYY